MHSRRCRFAVAIHIPSMYKINIGFPTSLPFATGGGESKLRIDFLISLPFASGDGESTIHTHISSQATAASHQPVRRTIMLARLGQVVSETAHGPIAL